jgi:PEP-CTERM motif
LTYTGSAPAALFEIGISTYEQCGKQSRLNRLPEQTADIVVSQRPDMLGNGRRQLQVQRRTLFDIFTLSVVPGLLVSGTHPEDLRLSGSTTPVPEPSTWAMMLAGFAGLGFVACRGSRKTQAAA